METFKFQLSGPGITSYLLNRLVVNKTVIQGIDTTEWQIFLEHERSLPNCLKVHDQFVVLQQN